MLDVMCWWCGRLQRSEDVRARIGSGDAWYA